MATREIEAIILKDFSFNDYDKIIIVFSKEYGKLPIKALGVNKLSSKNRFSVQCFSRSVLQIFKTNNPERMSKLKTGELVDLNINLAKNYQNYLYASTAVEIIDLAFENSIRNNEAFSNLKELIKLLNDDQNSTQNFAFFIFYSLDWFGSRWNLRKCINCGKKSSKFVNFDFNNYGLLCRDCNTAELIKVNESFLKLLQLLDISNFGQMIAAKEIFIKDIILLVNVLLEYLSNFMGVYITAIEILKKQKVFQNISFL